MTATRTAPAAIYADTFRTVYDAAIAAGATKADAAHEATLTASRAWVASNA